MESMGLFRRLAAAVCLAVFLPAGCHAEGEGAYMIDSFAALQAFSERVAQSEGGYTGNAVLTCDIGAEGELTPIGSAESMFLGTFDGGGHSISGLKVSGDEFSGLFGYVGRGGAVVNLTLVDAHVAGSRYTGGIAGYSAGRIERCRMNAGRIVGMGGGRFSAATGGIAGLSCGEIVDCSGLDVCVIGGRNTGGVVGNQCAGRIERCVCIAAVRSSEERHALAGGIAGGVQTGGEISGCIAAGFVRAPRGSWAGGVVGGLLSGRAGHCVSVCEVVGREAGGFAGHIGRAAQAINCRYIRGILPGVGEGSDAGSEALSSGGLIGRRMEKLFRAFLTEEQRGVPSMRLNVDLA